MQNLVRKLPITMICAAALSLSLTTTALAVNTTGIVKSNTQIFKDNRLKTKQGVVTKDGEITIVGTEEHGTVLKISYKDADTGEEVNGFVSASNVQYDKTKVTTATEENAYPKQDNAKNNESKKDENTTKTDEDKDNSAKNDASKSGSDEDQKEKAAEDNKKEEAKPEVKEEKIPDDVFVANDLTTSYTAKIKAKNVNLMSKKDKKSKKLAKLKKNDVVTILDDTDKDWVKVQYSLKDTNYNGFISVKDIELNEIVKATVLVSELPVYLDNDSKDEPIATLKKDKKVSVYEISEGWCKVDVNDDVIGYVDGSKISVPVEESKNGYGTVANNFIRLRTKPNKKSKPLCILSGKTNFAILKDEGKGKWYQLFYDGQKCYVMSEYIKKIDEVDGGFIQTVKDDTVVRLGPDNKYSEIRKVKAGKLFEVSGSVGDWYMIDCDGIVGYVKSSDVSTTSEDGFKVKKKTVKKDVDTDKPQRLEITATTLNLRETPNGTFILAIPKEAVVTVTGEDDGWYKVKYGEKEGYISGKWVKKTDRELTKFAPVDISELDDYEESSSDDEDYGSEPSAKTNSAVLEYAKQFVGNPYVWGGESLTHGCDCSGYVMMVFRHFGVSLPHSSASDRSVGKAVSVSNMQPGDIVCYSGHVGFYAGNGKLLSALGRKYGITYNNVHYKQILAVRRIF